MNWVLFSVIVLLAVFGFIGWKKGIIRIVVSLATLIITMLLAVFIAPVVCEAVKASTELDDNLQKMVYDVMMNQNFGSSKGETAGSEDIPKDVGELPEELKGIEADKGDMDKYVQQISDNAAAASVYAVQLIDKLNLTDNMKNQMKQMVSEQNIRNMVANNDIVKIIERTDGSVESVIAAVAAAKLADIIFSAIVYIIVFAVVFAILKIVVVFTNIVSRLPVIRQANKIGGLALGLVEGLIAVWILFVIITACGSMEWAVDAMADINSSGFLSMLYENDIILKMIFR